MIIIDQEGTLINSDRMAAFSKVQSDDGWLIVAFVDFGGATITIGHYATEELAEDARRELETAFNIPKHVHRMMKDIKPIEVVIGGDENADSDAG